MKHYHSMLSAAMLALATLGGSATSQAELVTDYKCDFNSQIDTSNPKFQVKSSWDHIIDEDGTAMSYIWYSSSGVGNSGALKAGVQPADNSVMDFLVTPVVSGNVKIKVKAQYTTNNSYIDIYTVRTKPGGDLWYDSRKLSVTGTKVENFTGQELTVTKLSNSSWVEVGFNVAEPQRLAIMASQVYLDDFEADFAEVTPEFGMSISSLVDKVGNTSSSGAYYAPAKADGSMDITYTLKVKNSGDLPLVAATEGSEGTEGYSVTALLTGKASNFTLGTVNVPQNLAVGEESEPFTFNFTIPVEAVTMYFPYTYTGGGPITFRENIKNGTQTRSNVYKVLYEQNLVMRAADTKVTTSVANVSFGICREDSAISYELYNGGGAPIVISSVTLPEAFTTNWPAEAVTLNYGDIQPLTITFPAENLGIHSGNVVVTYKDLNGEDKTLTLPITGSMLDPNAYVCDFNTPENTSTLTWPAGMVHEAGIDKDYKYDSATKKYDKWLKTSTTTSYQTANNKVFTPLLHAEAGDSFAFDVANANTSYSTRDQNFMKVYLSKDRKTVEGDPLISLGYADLTTDFATKTITIPEEGDYYIAFEMWGTKLDNLTGLKTVNVPNDLFIKEYKVNSSLDTPQSVQSGETVTHNLTIFSWTSHAAKSYKFLLHLNDSIVQASESETRAINNSESSQNIQISIKHEVEQTTTYNVQMELIFDEGLETEKHWLSDVKQLKVTVEPKFVFVDRGTNVGKYTTSTKAPINWGTVNVNGQKKQYDIVNYGQAPLTIKSITAPLGHTVNFTDSIIAAGEKAELDVTFIAEEPGVYDSNLVITYLDPEGADVTHEIAYSVTMLDPTKWYASFDNGTTTGAWPTGSLYQSAVQISNGGTSLAPDFYVYSSSAKTAANRMFITPKLTAEAGDSITFKAKLYSTSTSYTTGGVVVYAAPTREALAHPAEGEEVSPLRVELGEITNALLDDDNKLTTDFKTYSVKFTEAGDYYLGFDIYNGLKIDDIYGLKLKEVAHDWMLEGVSVPETGMQNIATGATLSVRNVGLHAEEAGSYTVTAYVNGVAAESEGKVALPMINKVSEAATSIPVSFRSPKVGTFPVYFELKAGDYTVTTDTLNVNFTPELLSSEIVVGIPGTGTNAVAADLLNLNYKNSETVVLFTPTDLKLNGGEKISKFVIRGFSKQEYTTNYSVYYQWTDDKEQAKPADGLYNTEGMIEYCTGEKLWTVAGDADNLVDMIVLNFDEPITYEAGKSLRLLVRSQWTAYATSGNHKFEKSTITVNCYQHQNDTQTTFENTQSWSAKNKPVLRVNLVVEPRTLSGAVTTPLGGDGSPVAGATVTLVSTDGDNVQYEAVTDEEGAYSVNVIQSGRVYDVEVAAELNGREVKTFDNDLDFSEGSQVRDFLLRPIIVISDDEVHGAGSSEAVVYITKSYPAGVSAVALPFDLSETEVKDVFGDDAQVFELVGDELNGTTVTASFSTVTTGMQAGKPYLLFLKEETEPFEFYGFKEVLGADEFTGRTTANMEYQPTTAPTPLTEGMLALSYDQFKPTMPRRVAEAATVPAYSAYIVLKNGAEDFKFTTDSNIWVGVEEVEGVAEGEDVIYTLDGVRVKNPAKGLYIVNGKVVILK